MSRKKYETVEIRLSFPQLDFINKIARESGVSPEQALSVMLSLFVREMAKEPKK